MKLIDTYKEYKYRYSKYVIFIKCGSFYEIFGEDCFIINNLFGYKIKDYNNSKRVGFPLSAYNKVIGKLNNFKVNYIVIDEDIVRKRFRNNNYDNYLNELDHYIKEKLKENI